METPLEDGTGMKGEFYKMEYEAWDEGTDDLTLEQESAYLRLCHLMYRRGGPVQPNLRVLSGIWRCHQNKAKALLAALLEKEKVTLTSGQLTNNRVESELGQREATRRLRSGQGKVGGKLSGEIRRNSLKNNNEDEAVASTQTKQRRGEERREEKKDNPLPPEGDEIDVFPDWIEGEETPSDDQPVRTRPARRELKFVWPKNSFETFWQAYPAKKAKQTAKDAFDKIRLKGEVDFEVLLAAVQSYAKTQDPAFYAHAATWLRAGRWEDEVSAPVTKPKGSLLSRMKGAV